MAVIPFYGRLSLKGRNQRVKIKRMIAESYTKANLPLPLVMDGSLAPKRSPPNFTLKMDKTEFPVAEFREPSKLGDGRCKNASRSKVSSILQSSQVGFMKAPVY